MTMNGDKHRHLGTLERLAGPLTALPIGRTKLKAH
jgi:hypothetical protein